MQLYKVRQRLGAVCPQTHILDLQPVETPFKKSWVRPCHSGAYIAGTQNYTGTYIIMVSL